ncbi:MAG: YHS domain-containing protein, partial [Planctomycetes bacterium]|nr:YHS domain-containing protein [Planctomycetota bacterium]
DDHARHDHAPAAADAKVTDPVCHMTIAKGDRKAEFHKADWYFCSDVCLQKFKADPAKFAKACACATAMKKCDCAHCGGKREPCACP